MTNLLKFSFRRSSIILLGLAFICLVRPSHARADCSSTLLVEDPYIEITTCVTGDSEETDAYADATSSEAEDIFLQVQFYTDQGEIDSQVGCGYESASAFTSVSPATDGYTVWTLYAGDGPDWGSGWGGDCGGYSMVGDPGPYLQS